MSKITVTKKMLQSTGVEVDKFGFIVNVYHIFLIEKIVNHSNIVQSVVKPIYFQIKLIKHNYLFGTAYEKYVGQYLPIDHSSFSLCRTSASILKATSFLLLIT